MKRKRILIITDLAVLPADAGNKARVWALMNNLRDLGNDVWFLGLGLKSEEGERIREVWGNNVHFIPRVRARAAKPLSYAFKRILFDQLFTRGFGSPDVDHWYWPDWDAPVRAFAAKHDFDAVIAEYVFFSKALEHFDDSILKIIDTHDIHTGRREKLKARKIKRFFRYLTDPAQEARALDRAHAIIAIQLHEAEFFRQLMDDKKPVVTVGHTVSVQPQPSPEGSANLLFLGSGYTANVDGLQNFLAKCWPAILAAVPHARLIIAGTICNALKTNAAAVEMLGEVAELRHAYARANLVINPVLAGTGLKTKSVEALGFGKAMVTTPCGAEGLEEAAGSAFIIGETNESFTDAVIQLLQHPAQVTQIAAEALRFVRNWNHQQLHALEQLLSTNISHDPSSNRAHFPSQSAAPLRNFCPVASAQPA